MPRAVICVRVSPRPEENVRYSPQIQEDLGRQWCEANGAEVAGVVQDIQVSGGDPKRFESIFRALDQLQPDTFVVQDLSRWTRDDPVSFWMIFYQLRERKVKLVSCDPSESGLDPDMPFYYTLTTAKVEMNYQERLRIKRKSAAGVRAAWEAGKRWGHAFGWSFDKRTREWTQDVPRITEFYRAYAEGESLQVIARRYGIRPANVGLMIEAKSQRDIVGDDLWNLAMERRRNRQRQQRGDAKASHLYRGLLRCPFCGWALSQTWSGRWGRYRCTGPQGDVPHDWTDLNVRTSVTPAMQDYLAHLYLPDELAQLPKPDEPTRRTREEITRILNNLTEQYVKGRISSDRYERLAADLEAERDAPPPPPLPEQERLLRAITLVNLEMRDPEGGAVINRLLRAVFSEVKINEDRSVTPLLKPQYEYWYRHGGIDYEPGG